MDSLSVEQAFGLFLAVVALLGFALAISWLIEELNKVDSQETDE